MDGMPSKPDDDVNLGPRLVADNWAQAAVAIIIVLLRIVAKYRMRRLMFDDYLMIFTLVSEYLLSTRTKKS
jgi:hypothetical protein